MGYLPTIISTYYNYALANDVIERFVVIKTDSVKNYYLSVYDDACDNEFNYSKDWVCFSSKSKSYHVFGDGDIYMLLNNGESIKLNNMPNITRQRFELWNKANDIFEWVVNFEGQISEAE